jgi:muramoyltetrapeptide carboxypeptidase LdcA involved in peptidoglycan recycling
MAMLTDPSIRVVVPRGRRDRIDLLPLADRDSIAAVEPTWFVGFSDISTLFWPMTLRTGIATLHTNNLMNTAPIGRAGPVARHTRLACCRFVDADIPRRPLLPGLAG